jgi:hypothetical protein
MAEIVVPVTDLPDTGRAAAVMQAGMIQTVGEDQRFFAKEVAVEQRR